ncbi:putative polysaccharide biosynthesis protein [Paenibacillus thermotolerans]|uniref:putative polysaccharide biosynthesis protein n=1 Tax=Paenibacillus thermotolerans TaxID=3027807 RepID=UPI0023689B3F|nr:MULTISPECIES: polysaccharide biosynthesis protein [unclassified Paenibacillus]
MKDTLLKGTMILAGAALVARVLGVVQRIPLQRLLDDAGMATYGIAYNVYFWLLILATAGFPSAVAKLVSEKYAVGRPDEGEAIHRAAVNFALTTGVLATIVVVAFAPLYAHISGDPGADLAIRALAPALLLFPWIAVERGYFQGRRMMAANGLSQVWEQIARVVTAVLLAYALLELGYGVNWAAAGASFGGVLGALAAAAVMLLWGRKLKKADREGGEPNVMADGGVALPGASPAASGIDTSSLGSIYRAMFRLSIPVSITALAVPTVYLIDSTFTIRLIEGLVGYDNAKDLLGMLTARAQSLAGIPVIFAIALSQSILPIISSAFIRGEQAEVQRQTSSALRMTLLSGVPAIVVLCVAAFPLNRLIFGDTFGTWVIIFLVVSSLFQVLMMTSGSILTGIDRPSAPLRNIGIGVASKFVFSLALAPFIGIWGIAGGTALCFAVTMTLNLLALRKSVDYSIMGGRTLRFAAAAAGQIAAGGALAWALFTYLHPFGIPFLNALLQVLLISGVTGVLYPILLLKTGAFTAADIAAMPAKARRLWSRAEPAMRKLRML